MAKLYATTVVKKATAEVGYLEKASNKSLNLKTKNAGDNNYTKYGKWYGMNGVYWCAIFQSYIFDKAFGAAGAKKLLLGDKSAACEDLHGRFVRAGQYKKTPKVGDLIFFSGSRHSGANHIGLVYKVTSSMVYTIEVFF